MTDLLFIQRPPTPPRPKPLHAYSEDELLRFVDELELRGTLRREETIKKLTMKAVDYWEQQRNTPADWRLRPFEFTTGPTHSSYLEAAQKPLAAPHWGRVTVTLPPWLRDRAQAEYLAERMIREQMS